MIDPADITIPTEGRCQVHLGLMNLVCGLRLPCPVHDNEGDPMSDVHATHEAHRFLTGVIDSLGYPDTNLGSGTAVFDHQTPHVERFMLAGNGPTAWLWFQFDGALTDSELTAAWLSYSFGGEQVCVTVPDGYQRPLLAACREDVRRGIEREVRP